MSYAAESDTICYQGIDLPAVFFSKQTPKSGQISPAAAFNPSKALRGASPWQNATSPSLAPKPKTLVITRKAINDLEFTDAEKRFAWLQALGFTLYLTCFDAEQQPIVTSLDPATRDTDISVVELLQHARDFKAHDDNEQLAAQFGVANDDAYIVGESGMQALLNCMEQSPTWQLIYPRQRSPIQAKQLYEVKYTSIIERSAKVLHDDASKLAFIKNIEFYHLFGRAPKVMRFKSKDTECLFNEAKGIRLSPIGKLTLELRYTRNYTDKLKLLEKHQHKIESGSDLLMLLGEIDDTTLKRKLFAEHQHKIKYLYELIRCIKVIGDKTFEPNNLEQYKSQIRSVGDVRFYLEYTDNDEERQDLLIRHQGLIDSNYDLASCLQLVSSDVIKLKIFEESSFGISSYYDLVQTMQAISCDEIKLGLYKLYRKYFKPVIVNNFECCLKSFTDDEMKLHVILIDLHYFIEHSCCGLSTLSSDASKIELIEELLPTLKREGLLERCLATISDKAKKKELHELYNCEITDLSLFDNDGERLEAFMKLANQTKSSHTFIELLGQLTPSSQAFILNHQDMSQLREPYCYLHVLPPHPSSLSKTSSRFTTSLCIWADSSNKLFQDVIAAIESGLFPNLAFVDIHGGDHDSVKKLVALLEQHCDSSLQRLMLPADCRDVVATTLPYDFLPKPLPFKFENGKERSPAAKRSQQGRPAATQPINAVHTAHNGLNAFNFSQGKPQNYTMAQTGRLLNPKGEPAQRVRTGRILQNIAKSSQRRYFQPDKCQLNPVKVTQLTDADINRFSQDTSNPNTRYHEFSLDLKSGLTRLSSIDAHEIFTGICQPCPKGVNIYHCDVDNFYYAETTQETSLRYVVEAETEAAQQARFQQIPADNIIKAVIDDYRNPNKGYHPTSTHKDKIPSRNIYKSNVTWLKATYNFRGGSCDHRVAAVQYKLDELGVDDNDVHVTPIDNNHVRLEVCHNNHWILVDVGGRSGNQQTYSDTSSKIPNPATSASSDTKGDTQHLILHEPSSKFCQLKENIAALVKPQTIENQEALYAIIADPDNHQVIIGYPESEQLTTHLLGQAGNRLIYIVDSFDALSTKGSSMSIDETGNITIVPHSSFVRFIEQAAYYNPGEPRPQLIIHWDAFTPQQQVALNTMLDKLRTVKGLTIPASIQIIGLYQQAPTDMALLSRYNAIGRVDYDLSPGTTSTVVTGADPLIIDMLGLPDWQAQLLGPIVLIDNRPVWQKSDFVTQLESGLHYSCIQLQHLPKEARDDCIKFLEYAKAQGYIDYHGYRIPLSQHSEIVVEDSLLDFSDFDVVTVTEYVTLDNAPKNARLINTAMFDSLLQQKLIANHTYQHRSGLLAKHAAKTLNLWISSELSDSQWYCLFAEAKRHNVKLALSLAPNVSLPAGLKTLVKGNQAIPSNPSVSSAPRVIVTDRYDVEMVPITDDTLVIDIEDHNYQDLFGYISHKASATHFESFTFKQSQLLKALTGNKPVVFKGRFSEAMLQSLQYLLAGKSVPVGNGKVINCTAPITVIVEVDSQQLPAEGMVYAPLAYLGGRVKVMRNKVSKTSHTSTFSYKETPPSVEYVDLSHCKEKTIFFLERRLQAILSALENYNIVQLLGPTGVGKSRLMHYLQQHQKDNLDMYHGLGRLDAWATHVGDKQAVLFLDEGNIIDKHLTFLSPLKLGGNKRIFYRGKIYELTDKHKVVIASNPHNYGGGRQQQRLFADGTVPELHFENFPPEVAYELLLRPLYDDFSYDPLNVDISIQSHEFEQQAKIWLMDYYQQCQVAKNDRERPTVRELQQQALQYLHRHQYRKPLNLFISHAPQAATSYAETQANLAQRLALNEFIQLHLGQQQGKLPGSGLGLNGCYIEGTPGTGKSALIEFMLTKHGYGTKHEGTPLWYDKIDATLPFSEMKQRIVEAFNNGQAIWIDELNSCDCGDLESAEEAEGIEAILNSVLTGVHPDTGQPAKIPGFMAFFTGNSIGLKGRKALSPALHHRCIQLSCSPLGSEDIHAILQHHAPEKIAGTNSKQLCRDLAHLIAEDPSINLRTLLMKIDDFVPLYAKQKISPPRTDDWLKLQKRLLDDSNPLNSEEYPDQATAYHTCLKMGQP